MSTAVVRTKGRTFPVTVTNGRLSREEAEALTIRIRKQMNSLWELVTEAHDRKAWQAMGYDSWRAYVRTELHMSASRSYQLIDTGHVMRVAQQVLGDKASNMLDSPVTAREAARAKDSLPALRRELKAKVKDGLEPKAALKEAIKALPAPRKLSVVTDKTEAVAPVKPRRQSEPRVPEGMHTCPRCGGLGYV